MTLFFEDFYVQFTISKYLFSDALIDFINDKKPNNFEKMNGINED